MLAGQGPASGGVTAPPGTLQPGVSVVLTAAREPQARILNPGAPTGLSATAGNGQVTLFLERAGLRRRRGDHRLRRLPGHQLPR